MAESQNVTPPTPAAAPAPNAGPTQFPVVAPEKKRFKSLIMLAAPRARVFKALTEPAELTRWFCRSASVDLKPGGEFRFGAGSGEGARWEVKAVDPGSSLELLRPEPLRLELWEKPDGRTLLHLEVHIHEDAPDAAEEHILWSTHLLFLKAWLENGIDLREPDAGKTWKDGYVNGLEPF